MPNLSKVGGKLQIAIERFDGGRNTKDAPSRIGVYETPDSLNVVFDKQGAVATRFGSKVLNTSVVETGSNVIDGLGVYKNTMCAWAGGSMFRLSGTTWVTVGSSQGMFTTGAKVAWCVYQDILFCSDAATGPMRWEGGQNFYRVAIPTPSAPSASAAGGGGINSGTYYYKIQFQNTHVVNGAGGTVNSTSNPNTACTLVLTNVPVGATSQGVAKRMVYRASTSAGPYRYVGQIADNSTVTFTDSVSATTWAQGALLEDYDGGPTPWHTVHVFKERLFFDYATDQSFVGYTEYENPFSMLAENIAPLHEGGGWTIQAISDQDNLLSMFTDGSIWLWDLVDPSDDATWNLVKSPANLGICGPRALWQGPGHILFVGRSPGTASFGTISGFHILSGVDVADVANDVLRTKDIASKIEPDIKAIPTAFYDDIAMVGFANAIHVAHGGTYAGTTDTYNNHVWWFDINRVADSDIGSWSLWDNLPISCWVVTSGALYGGSSIANGYVYQLNLANTYNDRGSAINSYFWTKEYGGETELESWYKDFRLANIWYNRMGDWEMVLKYRMDGDKGSGNSINIDLNPGGALWGAFLWGAALGGGVEDWESQHSLGLASGRRIQLGFTNGNAAGQAFTVYGAKILMNLRRQR